MLITNPKMQPASTHAETGMFGRPAGLVAVVIYKALAGVFEIMTGTIFLFSRRLIASELVEDPSDRFVSWLLSHASFSYASVRYLGFLAIALGVIELLLAVGIWHRSSRFRSAALVFFGALAVYGCFELVIGFSAFKLVSILADFGVVYYLWMIMPKHAPSMRHRKS